MTDWISIDERMPEQNCPILIYCPERKGRVFIAIYERNWQGVVNGDGVRWMADMFFGDGVAYTYKQDVSHWMPLPDPPTNNNTEPEKT